MTRRFRNRLEAGERLGPEVRRRIGDEAAWVLAIPRGGVAVGYGVAKALRAPMEILVARKIGAPHNPELGIGAISHGGVTVWNNELIGALGLSPSELERLKAREALELKRREHVYRRGRPMPDLGGRTAVVVDDGLATGITARAAVEAARGLNAARVVLAVPVCAPESARELRPYVDDLICLEAPDHFYAVGVWYVDFPQMTDEEVLAYFEAANRSVNC